MSETTIRWREVDAAEAERNGIYCTSGGGQLATWCRQWQTAQMAAPAFVYYCTEHAEAGAKADGIALTPEAEAMTVDEAVTKIRRIVGECPDIAVKVVTLFDVAEVVTDPISTDDFRAITEDWDEMNDADWEFIRTSAELALDKDAPEHLGGRA